VNQGLVDKIYERDTSASEREAWLAEERSACASSEVWEQEYCCTAIDESTAFLSYALIDACRRSLILNDYDSIVQPFFLGFDAGRRGDFSIVWGLQQDENLLQTCIYHELQSMKFADQEAILYEILAHPMLQRACFDETGLGMQLAERAQDKFGKSRIEAVYFTAKIKDQLAHDMRGVMEASRLLLPDDEAVRRDFHAVQKQTTIAGNIRFNAKRSADGHADRFWAAALALHAASSPTLPIPSVRSRRRAYTSSLKGFRMD
jgi:phage FluMu gp28-like protein